MLNSVNVMGRLVTDPELRYTASGVAYVKVSVACKRSCKNAFGEYDVDYFDVMFWKGSAEFVANCLPKGQLVAIVGKLKQNRWTDKDGRNRSTVEIDALSVESVGGKAANSEKVREIELAKCAAPAPEFALGAFGE